MNLKWTQYMPLNGKTWKGGPNSLPTPRARQRGRRRAGEEARIRSEYKIKLEVKKKMYLANLYLCERNIYDLDVMGGGANITPAQCF